MEASNRKWRNGPFAKIYEQLIKAKTNIFLNFCNYVLENYGLRHTELETEVSHQDQKVADPEMPLQLNSSFPCKKQYLHKKYTYLFDCSFLTDSEEDILINLTRTSDNKVTSTIFNLNQIPKLEGQIQENNPTWTSIRKQILKDLIDPFVNNPPSPPPTEIPVCVRDFSNFVPPPPSSNSSGDANPNFYSKPPEAAGPLKELPFECFPAGATLPRGHKRVRGGGRGRGTPLSRR